MAVGNYGVIRPADVDINDIVVYYSYAESRETQSTNMIEIDSSEVLEFCYVDDNDEEGDLLEGLYNLKLPSTIFNETGIYTIYLKPKTIEVNVVECGVLSTLPNVIGLIINPEDLDDNLRTNNALQGYRIEYLDNDREKIRNRVRYVVSSNRVTKEEANTTNAYQISSNSYVFDDTNDNSFIFLQVTPSSAYDIKPNVRPEIGDSGSIILLSNTYFSPVMIEIEMVENTIDTLGDLIAGEQLKDVEKGIISHFDNNREITRQFDVYKIKDDVDDRPLYEVKERRTAIDNTQSLDGVISEIE